MHPDQKLNGGDNTVSVRFKDKESNQFVHPVIIADVQKTGLIGKWKQAYPNSPIFKVADYFEEAFGTQEMEKLYNLSGIGLFKKTNSMIKGTGHYKIDKQKYKQEYGSDPDEDENESRENIKKNNKKTGFLAKIKNKMKFRKNKSKSFSKLTEFYSTSDDTSSNVIEIPVIDQDDNKPETIKIEFEEKSEAETDKDAQTLIKNMLSKPISGKTLNTNNKMSALIPLVKAKMNLISGLHQWQVAFKDKKNEKKDLNETNKVELNFSKSKTKSKFALSINVNEVKKVNADINLNLLPKRIDANSWGLTTSSSWDNLLKNIAVSLKLNTAKYKLEIVNKKSSSKLTTEDENKSFNLKITAQKGEKKPIIAPITLFNIKQGKSKTSAFDKLSKKTKEISKKMGKSLASIRDKLFNKKPKPTKPTTTKPKPTKPTTTKPKPTKHKK